MSCMFITEALRGGLFVKKKGPFKQEPPAAATITQQKRDRVASILAFIIGLLSIREGGSVLLGVVAPVSGVPNWLFWYHVLTGIVSVTAGAGILRQTGWSIAISLNMLSLHAIVFANLFAQAQLGQNVAARSIYAMLLRTLTWIVIYSLLRWKRRENSYS